MGRTMGEVEVQHVRPVPGVVVQGGADLQAEVLLKTYYQVRAPIPFTESVRLLSPTMLPLCLRLGMAMRALLPATQKPM